MIDHDRYWLQPLGTLFTNPQSVIPTALVVDYGSLFPYFSVVTVTIGHYWFFVASHFGHHHASHRGCYPMGWYPTGMPRVVLPPSVSATCHSVGPWLLPLSILIG